MPKELIRADSVRLFVEHMVRRGIPLPRLLRGTAIDATLLDEKDARILSADYLRVVSNALDECGDPALGLSFGQEQNLAEFGVWGYAIISSATVGEAAQIALKFWELNGALVKLRFKREEEFSTVEIFPAFFFGSRRLLIFAVELMLAAHYSSCSFLVRREIRPTEIRVTYPKPDHAALYYQIFGCPVMFESDTNRTQMKSHDLDLPTIMAHPQFAELCRRQCEEMLLKLRESDELVDNIRRQLISTPGRFPKFADMADKLVMSPRTLRRRLKERNTSYQEILDEVRAELAREYLTTTNLSIDQISDLIGFSETTTFRSAYKKWTGQSAAEVKRQESVWQGSNTRT